MSIVVLGDSYSAGNGARDANGDRAYWGPRGCYRSDYNWSGLYSTALASTYSPSVTRVACSGGVTTDIFARRDMDDTVTVPRFVGCPEAKWDEIWVRENINLLQARCSRFLKPQIDSVGSNTDLVLFTAGGNDVRFASIVEQCFAVGLRDPGDCKSNVDSAFALATTQLPGRLDGVFGALRAKLRPNAQVAYLGYPYLVGDVDYTLKTINPFSDGEYHAGNEVRRVGDTGDAVQRAAVTRSNAVGTHKFTYVDGAGIKELFKGREPNPDQSAPRNPDRWLYEFETRIPAEWYHYNPRGHQGLADYLRRNLQLSTPSGGTRSNDVDIVFAVDTTGSMGGVIGSVRDNLTQIVDELAASTRSFQVGVVSYRDFPSRTGYPNDYAARVDTTLTSNRAAIASAIASLAADGGGDYPEAVFSGIDAGLSLSWRSGVSKVLVVIGDAPPLGPPEPVSGLTVEQLVAHALSIDPVQVFFANTGGLDTVETRQLAAATGGSVVSASDIVTTIRSVVSAVTTQPFGWLASPHVGKVGVALTFDATGSYDPTGAPLTSYEWDVDGDGTYDATTSTPTFTYTFAVPFSGTSVVRVTGANGTALGSGYLDVNATGSSSMGDAEPCATGPDGKPVVTDAEGRALACEATLPPDPPGLVVTSRGSYTVTFLPPAKSVPAAGATVPLQFALVNSAGVLIADAAAAALLAPQCAVTVSASGAQTLTPTCPTYDPTEHKFKVNWKTAPRPSGSVTIAVTGASAAPATTTITLR